MSFTQSRGRQPSFSIRYSSFLGMMYLSTPEVEAHIDRVKGEAGESEVKKGYQGYQGETPSAVALRKLNALDIRSGVMTGALTSARITMVDIVGGKQAPYLNVGVRSQEGRFYLSVPADNSGAQLLIRKLANAKPDVYTELKLFGVFEKREGADRPYGDHKATLKQGPDLDNLQEVKGVDPSQVLKVRVDDALSALRNAGVDDKDMLSKRREKVTLDYHLELMAQVEANFKAFYDERDKNKSAAQSTAQDAPRDAKASASAE